MHPHKHTFITHLPRELPKQFLRSHSFLQTLPQLPAHGIVRNPHLETVQVMRSGHGHREHVREKVRLSEDAAEVKDGGDVVVANLRGGALYLLAPSGGSAGIVELLSEVVEAAGLDAGVVPRAQGYDCALWSKRTMGKGWRSAGVVCVSE